MKKRDHPAKSSAIVIKFKRWDIPKNFEVFDRYKSGLSEIVIGREPGSPSLKYAVQDPTVSEKELEQLGELAGELIYTARSKEEFTKEKFEEALKKKNLSNPVLLYYIDRELWGYGPLTAVMADPKVENVECNKANSPVTVTHTDYGRIETNMVFTDEELDKLVMRLAHLAGKSVSIFKPFLDGVTIPGGHRYTCTYRTEISSSSTFAIRKFPEKPWTITKLLINETITPEMAAWIWLMIETRQATLVAGVMGSGKTSLINALASFAPPHMKIGSAEDVPEFRLPHTYWLRYVIRDAQTIEGTGAVTIFDLLKLLLRSNVDYILVNEIRGEDAKVWMQAVATGHGGVTSIHAEDPESVFARLEQLGIPAAHLSALKGIAFIGFIFHDIGKGYFRRIRKVREFFEVKLGEGEKEVKRLFWYEAGPQGGPRSVPLEELLSTNSAKVVSEYLGLSKERLMEEYLNRVEFLKWMRDMALAKPETAEMEYVKQFMTNFYIDKTFYKSIPVPARPEHAVKEKKDVPIVKPKVTIQGLTPTGATGPAAEAKTAAGSGEKGLGDVKLVGVGDLVLKPPRVVKKGKMVEAKEETEEDSGGILTRLRKERR
ncbi:MAG: type II/IV secretion system ATPase subunit [Thaumarchaeota archaeon]|nr:type II/IV secretion system ATPase subunit [Candidatus Calditenuaceae archaeon]